MKENNLLAENVQSLIGTEVDLGWGVDQVCQPVIRYLCEAIEDGNPLYRDEEFAKEMGYNGVIAPPTMAMTFCKDPVWPPQKQEVKILDLIPLDLPEGLVQSIDYEFFAPIEVGDRLRAVEKLASISPEKTTHLGTGHFVVIQRFFYNQKEELVSTLASTLFRYRRGSEQKSRDSE